MPHTPTPVRPHDCFRSLVHSALFEHAVCARCGRTVADIRGPKLADLRDALLGFTLHRIDPYVGVVGEPALAEDGPSDLLVSLDVTGRITDVRLTEAGLARIRRATALLEISGQTAMDAVSAAFRELMTRRLAGPGAPRAMKGVHGR